MENRMDSQNLLTKLNTCILALSTGNSELKTLYDMYLDKDGGLSE